MSDKKEILKILLTIIPNPKRWMVNEIHVRSYIIYYVTKQGKAISVESHFVLPFLDIDYVWMLAKLVELNALKKVCKLKRI